MINFYNFYYKYIFSKEFILFFVFTFSFFFFFLKNNLFQIKKQKKTAAFLLPAIVHINAQVIKH